MSGNEFIIKPYWRDNNDDDDRNISTHTDKQTIAIPFFISFVPQTVFFVSQFHSKDRVMSHENMNSANFTKDFTPLQHSKAHVKRMTITRIY